MNTSSAPLLKIPPESLASPFTQIIGQGAWEVIRDRGSKEKKEN
jgi:hypothetical protein